MRLKNQKGSVLILSLILLTVMTIIAVSSMNIVVQNEKMTMNERDLDASFQSAESALRNGESWLASQTTKPNSVSTCETPPCNVFTTNSLGNVATQNAIWWNTNGRAFNGSLGTVTTQPVFIIEEMMFVPYELDPQLSSAGYGYYYYHVFSNGSGTNNANTILESIYSVIFG